MNDISTLKPQADPFVLAMINDARAEIAACGQATIANSQSQIAKRCPICGTHLIRWVEAGVCVHCETGVREDIELVNAHFRVPAGELARVNPSFIRRMA